MAQTIAEVMDELTRIVDDCQAKRLRLGYFAALYRRVTHKVQQGIADGFFEDGARMERLDVVFANRYLDAYKSFRATGKSSCSAWQSVFSHEKAWSPLILQHLLFGMNVHINLDLGIAAAEVSDANTIGELRTDFDRINKLLAAEMPLVRERIDRLSPMIHWLDNFGGETDTVVVNFSMEIARGEAWSFATELAPLSGSARTVAIESKRAFVNGLTHKVAAPGAPLSWGLLAIRLFESGDASRVIRDLRE